MTATTSWAIAHPYIAAAAAAVLLAAAVIGLRSAVRAARRISWRAPSAVVVAAAAAAACTAYSADTSWRFAAHSLDMASTAERAAMFFAAELALFSCALMARQNLKEHGAPGTPGLLVWGITGVQVIPAYSESGIVGGTVRAVVGPVLAALLWHLAMGIELRHAKPGAHSQSLPAVLFREARERLLSRLGLAVRDRSAEQILRDRWTVRAVSLAARLADMAPEKRGGWVGRRAARRLSVAVGRAQAGADESQRRMLLDLLAARRHATALATVALPSPWHIATGERATVPAKTATPAATPRPARSATAVAPATPPALPAATTPVAPQPKTATPAMPEPATVASADSPTDYAPGTPQHVVHALWLRLGHRPAGPAIVDALGVAGLANSPQQARKIRAQVEREQDDLPGLRAA